MADALAKYLATIDPYAGFVVGDEGVPKALGAFQDEFLANGRPRPGLELALSAMKVAWEALPAEIREQAIAALEQALSQVAGAVGQGLGGVPVVGQIFKIVVDGVLIFVRAGKQAKDLARESSGVSRNNTQYLQFATAHPSEWIYTAKPVRLYRDWGCSTLTKACYRSRPCLVPIWNEESVIGWDKLPAPIGSCGSGKEYSHAGGFADLSKMKEKSGSDPCDAWVLFSALYFPFWSPNAAATFSGDPVSVTRPLDIFTPNPDSVFSYPKRDPNAPLIERQALLLADPIFNLQADSGRALRRMQRFLKWFDLNVPAANRPDAKFDQKNEEIWSGRMFWRDRNGMLRLYRAAKNQGFSLESPLVRAPDYGVPYPYDEYGGANGRRVTISAGAYNCIVAMTIAFFTARRGFLANREAMKVYAQKIDGKRLVDSFDGPVRAAVRAAAEGESVTVPILTGVKAAAQPVILTGAKVTPPRAQRDEGISTGTKVAIGATAAAAVAGGVYIHRRRSK